MGRAWTSSRSGAGPHVIAHRGAPEASAENTLDAFARARQLGAEGVELDVRLAADGEPVVVHDADLARLAGRAERIESLPSSRLAEVELAAGGSIPRLAEALAKTRDLLANVEIKSPRFEGGRLGFRPAAALVDAVIRDVDREVAAAGGARAEQILVSSFDPLALLRLRWRRPRALVALLFHARQGLPFRRALPASLVRPLALHPQEVLACPRALARWRARGYRVHPWTVNDPERARRLATGGASALITDAPARVRDAIARRGL